MSTWKFPKLLTGTDAEINANIEKTAKKIQDKVWVSSQPNIQKEITMFVNALIQSQPAPLDAAYPRPEPSAGSISACNNRSRELIYQFGQSQDTTQDVKEQSRQTLVKYKNKNLLPEERAEVATAIKELTRRDYTNTPDTILLETLQDVEKATRLDTEQQQKVGNKRIRDSNTKTDTGQTQSDDPDINRKTRVLITKYANQKNLNEEERSEVIEGIRKLTGRQFKDVPDKELLETLQGVEKVVSKKRQRLK